MSQTPQIIVDEIFSLLSRYGDQLYGEDVSQIEHMVQAATLAEAEGQDDEVILAAFLHDIGHLSALEEEHEKMGELGMLNHERHGAEFLQKRGFSDKIIFLVEGHVAAKRYLTWKDPHYYQKLSKASKQTLVYQGGPMDDKEGVAFERHPLFPLCLHMRKWDDEAKEPNMSMPDLSSLKEKIFNHLQNSSSLD